MCDQELIAAILEELGYLDEKKEEDKKEEVPDEGTNEDNLEDGEKEEKK